jgi:hypothetical protein
MSPRKKMAPLTNPKSRSKTAFSEAGFFHQLKNGGERGWNDQYVDPKDSATGAPRFYLRYYNAVIASVELVEKDSEEKTKITIFGTSDKAPVPSTPEIPVEEWTKLSHNVIEAIQSLYQS